MIDDPVVSLLKNSRIYLYDYPKGTSVASEVHIPELISVTQISSPEDVAKFHKYRQQAYEVAQRIYEDRANSYNVNHEPYDEMVYGALSLASEIFKRSIRMTGLITPLRTAPLRQEDIARLADSALDLINYSTWMYALIQVAIEELGFEEIDHR